MNTALPSTKVLGVNITTAQKNDILEFVSEIIKKRVEKAMIVTPNPEILVMASRSKHFQTVLNNATVSLPDGVGVVVAGNILINGIKSRIAGVDFMLELCNISVKEGFTIGLLGGRNGVAEATAKCLVKEQPQLRVVIVGENWPESGVMRQESERVEGLNEIYNQADDQVSSTLQDKKTKIPHIDILFVAFGAPKQEEWIDANLSSIDVSVAMGVGGAFDYISGRIPRAPRAVRSIGMEWLFRLIVQPWRIRRQLALPVFLVKVLQEKYK